MTIDETKPLDGEEAHPLSEVARVTLGRLLGEPIPRSQVNPGVADRLEREGLVEVVDLPSPFRTVRGKVRHLRVTEAGRQRLAEPTSTGSPR